MSDDNKQIAGGSQSHRHASSSLQLHSFPKLVDYWVTTNIKLDNTVSQLQTR